MKIGLPPELAIDRPRENGWHANPMTDIHTLFDVFLVDGEVVGWVEAFDDDGPFYTWVLSASKTHLVRSGGKDDLAYARAEVERRAGLAPMLPEDRIIGP